MLSLDGYISDKGGQINLTVPEEALHRHFNELQERTSLSLYGRRMYEAMRYWEAGQERSGSPAVEQEFARIWQATPKVVVSTTLTEVGPNARLIKTDVEQSLRRLKAETSGEIDVGGAALAASLARFSLIDEYRLYFCPVVLGAGIPFFEAGLALELEPIASETLPQGIILLRYRPLPTPSS
jgi:dihydrofolate reductase